MHDGVAWAGGAYQGAISVRTHGAPVPGGLAWGMNEALHAKVRDATNIAYVVVSVLIIIAVLAYFALR